MVQKNIEVAKTARYFLSGEITAATKEIWFVCHGYGQLASYFIRNFEVLENDNTVVVAPEGLNRFYWGGFSGRIVASWMTKEDREHEIRDYVNYLDLVYKEVLSGIDRKHVKVNVLGFSQGTATVCRWLAAGNSKADKLILWAGAFPSDMDLKLNRTVLDALKTYIVIGDADEFINEAQVKEQQELMDKSGLSYEMVRFSGKHEITEEPLRKISESI